MNRINEFCQKKKKWIFTLGNNFQLARKQGCDRVGPFAAVIWVDATPHPISGVDLAGTKVATPWYPRSLATFLDQMSKTPGAAPLQGHLLGRSQLKGRKPQMNSGVLSGGDVVYRERNPSASLLFIAQPTHSNSISENPTHSKPRWSYSVLNTNCCFMGEKQEYCDFLCFNLLFRGFSWAGNTMFVFFFFFRWDQWRHREPSHHLLWESGSARFPSRNRADTSFHRMCNDAVFFFTLQRNESLL